MSSYGGDSEDSEYSMDMGWSTEYSPSDSGSNEWPYWTSGGSGSDQSASDPSDGNNSEQEDADSGDEDGNGNGLAPVTPIPSIESNGDLPGLSHDNDTETTASLATVENGSGEQGGTVIVVQMPTHGPEWDVSDVEGADSLPAYDEDTPPVYDAHDADSTQPPVQLQIDVQFAAQPSPTLPRTTHGPSCPCAVCVMVYGPQTLNVTPPQPSAAELEAERQARVERWRAAHADSDSNASEADETTPLNEAEGHWGYATVAAMSHEENERRQRRQRRRERRRRQQQQGYARASIRRSLEIANRVYAVSGLLGNRRTEHFLALCCECLLCHVERADTPRPRHLRRGLPAVRRARPRHLLSAAVPVRREVLQPPHRVGHAWVPRGGPLEGPPRLGVDKPRACRRRGRALRSASG